jgi:hypothetical protein
MENNYSAIMELLSSGHKILMQEWIQTHPSLEICTTCPCITYQCMIDNCSGCIDCFVPPDKLCPITHKCKKCGSLDIFVASWKKKYHDIVKYIKQQFALTKEQKYKILYEYFINDYQMFGGNPNEYLTYFADKLFNKYMDKSTKIIKKYEVFMELCNIIPDQKFTLTQTTTVKLISHMASCDDQEHLKWYKNSVFLPAKILRNILLGQKYRTATAKLISNWLLETEKYPIIALLYNGHSNIIEYIRDNSVKLTKSETRELWKHEIRLDRKCYVELCDLTPNEYQDFIFQHVCLDDWLECVEYILDNWKIGWYYHYTLFGHVSPRIAQLLMNEAKYNTTKFYLSHDQKMRYLISEDQQYLEPRDVYGKESLMKIEGYYNQDLLIDNKLMLCHVNHPDFSNYYVYTWNTRLLSVDNIEELRLFMRKYTNNTKGVIANIIH